MCVCMYFHMDERSMRVPIYFLGRGTSHPIPRYERNAHLLSVNVFCLCFRVVDTTLTGHAFRVFDTANILWAASGYPKRPQKNLKLCIGHDTNQTRALVSYNYGQVYYSIHRLFSNVFGYQAQTSLKQASHSEILCLHFS